MDLCISFETLYYFTTRPENQTSYTSHYKLYTIALINTFDFDRLMDVTKKKMKPDRSNEFKLKYLFRFTIQMATHC